MSKLTKIILGLGIFALIPIALLSSPKPTQAFEQHLNSLVYEVVDQSSNKLANYVDYQVNRGDTINMWVTLKNRSRNSKALMWYGKNDLPVEGPNYPNAHCIGIGTTEPRDREVYFLDESSFVINNNRFTYYNGSPVYKGDNLTLNWQIKITSENYPKDGVFSLKLAPVREFDEWGLRVNASNVKTVKQYIEWIFVVGNPTLHTYSIVDDYLVKNHTQKILSKKVGMMVDTEMASKYGWTDPAEEWLQFKNNGKVYLYINWFRGCGGCSWVNYYFEINPITNEATLRKDSSSGLRSDGVISPDETKVVFMRSIPSNNNDSTESIWIYNLITKTKIKLLDLPSDATVESCGDGCRMMTNTILWNGNTEITISPYQGTNVTEYNCDSSSPAVCMPKNEHYSRTWAFSV